MTVERTLVLLKPDAVMRGITGDIISRFERVGLKIVALKLTKATAETAKQHYSDKLALILGGKTKKEWESRGKQFTGSVEEIGQMVIKSLRNMLTKHPVMAICLEGVDVVENVRKIIGPTACKDALPGTVRGDYGHLSISHANSNDVAIINLIHASGNLEEAKEELVLWFTPEEYIEYKSVNEPYTINVSDW